jgi:glutamate 5-kinase
MLPARRQLADAHRIVVKLGTHVVTHDGVELALGRLMGLIESMARLRQAGREILLVARLAPPSGRGTSWGSTRRPSRSWASRRRRCC